MTNLAKKNEEQRIAASAARLLGVSWELTSCERPDFMVDDRTHCFGLEVHEIHAGKVDSRRGAELRRKQIHTQICINEMRSEYERQAKGTAISVKLVGRPEADDKDQIIQELISMKLPEKEDMYFERRRIQVKYGKLKLYVRKLPPDWPRDGMSRPDWICASDTTGWVEDGREKIQRAIWQKAAKLHTYRANVANWQGSTSEAETDVRLLLYSNRMWSYGMVNWNAEVDLELGGFDQVICFSFPESPLVLRN